ncbi:MAG: FtsW/RodA/SpoVE family cell cycle protein [Candidatus Levybacteria bacterium]|nr:FtsW/RodA/SpoVE family cell cycle protein [Candidatus Levybacteria bacterium]
MNRFSIHRIDFSLLIPAVLLVVLSLSTLLSIDFLFFRQQVLFLLSGIFLYFVFLNIDYRFFALYPKYLYALIIIGFIIVLTFGTVVNGSKSWLVIFGIHLQVEEFLKPFFIIVIAHFLAYAKYPNIAKYFLAMLIAFPILVLILRQPDTGTALMYIASFVGMLLMYGFPMKYYFLSLLAVTVPAPFALQFLKPYQKERLVTLFNLTADPSGSSYNAIQALISIGSGGFFGKGLGEGTQSVLRFLPERQTDFIFASISEGLGFLGGVSIIALMFFLLYRIYRVSQRLDDTYAYLIVMGIFFLLLAQSITNIGMNMGMMPIIGVTLPFVSYGGSSLVTTFILLGIVSSIGYENKKHRTIEIG